MNAPVFMICPKCGNMVPDGRTQCPLCDAGLPVTMPLSEGSSAQIVTIPYETPKPPRPKFRWTWKWRIAVVLQAMAIILVMLTVTGVFTPDVALNIIGGGHSGPMYGSGRVTATVENWGKKTAYASKIIVEVTGDRIQTKREGWTAGDIPPGQARSMDIYVVVTSTGQTDYHISVEYDGKYQDSWP